jgi:hypothetical protein
MDRILNWLRSRSNGVTSTQSSWTPASDESRRNSRTDQIRVLQANISRLQQERLKLSNAEVRSGNEQMTRVERELETTQRDLAKIQGRI